MFRVVVPAARARSSMRYSPEPRAPFGYRTAASNSCETAFSTTSRDWRRTRLGARRRFAKIPAMVPVSARGGRSGAIASGGRAPTYGGVLDRVVIGVLEIAHLSKILGGESR